MNRSQMLAALAAQSWSILPRAFNALVAGLPQHVDAPGGLFDPSVEAARAAAGKARTTGSVAVVPVHGAITKHDSFFSLFFGGTSVDWLAATIRELVADESIVAIILDVDSPGGTISGLPELAATIRAARDVKPIVAITNDLNASAAYWIASQASEVVSTAEGLTGSIGVFTMHVDISEALAAEGVAVTLISAGKFKTEGNEFEPLGDEAKGAIQGIVNDGYDLFVADVAKGRNVTPKAVRDGYGQGRVLTAADAKAAGLVDRVGSMAETVQRVASGQAGRRAAAMAGVKNLTVRFNGVDITSTVQIGTLDAESPVPTPEPEPAPVPPEPQVDLFAFEQEARRRRGLVTSSPDSAGAFLGR